MVGQVGCLSGVVGIVGIVGENEMPSNARLVADAALHGQLLPIALFKKEMPIPLCRHQKRLAARVDKKNW